MNRQAPTVRTPATYQDVLDAPPNMVAELVGGTLHLQPRPASRHARASFKLACSARRPVRERGGRPGRLVLRDRARAALRRRRPRAGPRRLAARADGRVPRRPRDRARARLGLRDPEPRHAAVRPDREAGALRRARASRTCGCSTRGRRRSRPSRSATGPGCCSARSARAARCACRRSRRSAFRCRRSGLNLDCDRVNGFRDFLLNQGESQNRTVRRHAVAREPSA